MNAPPPKKLLKLTRKMARYDFSKEPLASADIVIEKKGRICKNKYGEAGAEATAQQLAAAEEVGPNR